MPVKRAQAAGNRTEIAKELKKMIAFNTSVVTELVADICDSMLGTYVNILCNWLIL